MAGALCLLLPFQASGQTANGYVHESSTPEGYVWPTEQAVLDNLDRWRDMKFGVLFHWGLYSVAGICESWPICSEDEEWIPRNKDMHYEEFKKWYWGLSKEFNPTRFSPEQWAEVMQDAGMKYMVFTTKHHDGFCMFDSKYTDFSIANFAFKNHPKKDVARHVFDAFRQKGFMIGCYFSKPDWHCEWFWNPYFATPNRGINYRKDKHPDWWEKYQKFTTDQLDELTSNYGKLDILWLDGGWVTGDDVNLDRVLEKARQTHPGLISVDRSIRGKNENYQTPERSIPEKQLSHPWESCITLSYSWGWIPEIAFKSPNEVLALLAEITAKGGCLLLGVGPTPQGLIQPEVETCLRQVGKWLDKNGQAIYSTRITPVYNDGNVWFTADKDGKTLYAIYTVKDGEEMPATIEWKGNVPTGTMKLLNKNVSVRYQCDGDKVKVTLPKGLANEPLAFRFTVKK